MSNEQGTPDPAAISLIAGVLSMFVFVLGVIMSFADQSRPQVAGGIIIVALMGCVVGAVFGCKALSEVGRGAKVMAVAGTILSAVPLLLMIFGFLFVYAK